MKFKIIVENSIYNKIESEIFEGKENDYQKIIDTFTSNDNNLPKLDFYDKKGNYVIIPSKIVNDSIVYIQRV